MFYQLSPLGDQAILINLGEDINMANHKKIQIITSYLDDQPFEWMIEYIPAFTTVTIFYDPIKITHLNQGSQLPYYFVCKQLNNVLSDLTAWRIIASKTVHIPVCYGGELGPDLETVAQLNNLTTEEVIHIHTSGDYLVYMIGFAPGFPYIGGMSKKIAAPRRKSPRLKIPERSVGIAGEQTGIYPIETPGGWQIIGRTPLQLFQPLEKSPSLLKAGDKIKFKFISFQEYIEWENDNG